MKGRLERLQLIAKVKQQSAQQLLADYNTTRKNHIQETQKYHQLIQYKADYSNQLTNRGQAGYAMDKMKHVVNFINQLDHLIEQQFKQINNLQKQVTEAHNIYLKAKIDEDSLTKLIEKLKVDMSKNENRLLQKLCDEMIQNQWHVNNRHD